MLIIVQLILSNKLSVKKRFEVNSLQQQKKELKQLKTFVNVVAIVVFLI